MIRGLAAGLLVLATLVMFAGSGSARTFVQADLNQPLETVITDTVSTDRRVPAAEQVLNASQDMKRPCHRRGVPPGLARCQSVQCITICGALPAAMFAIHPPSADADRHTSPTDESLCGISTAPDLSLPRLSA
jgi:hypothetical protein